MKNMRRSLLLSAVCLALTVAMLAGATLAWFTDSISNKGNIITAGELKLQATAYPLNMSNTESVGYILGGFNDDAPMYFAEQGQDLESNTRAIIEESLWEPGRSNAKLLVLKNIGNLNLMVKFDFVITENALTDALWYCFTPMPSDGTPKGDYGFLPMNGIETQWDKVEWMMEPEQEIHFLLMYGMSTEAGKEYMNKSFSCDLSIQAKQAPGDGNSESEGLYDVNAPYPDEITDGNPSPDEKIPFAEFLEKVSFLPDFQLLTVEDEPFVAGLIEDYFKLDSSASDYNSEQAYAAYYRLQMYRARITAIQNIPNVGANTLLYRVTDSQSGDGLFADSGDGMDPGISDRYVWYDGAEAAGYGFNLRFYVPQAGSYNIKIGAGSKTGDEMCGKVIVNGETSSEYYVYRPEGTPGAWVDGYVQTATNNPIQEFHEYTGGFAFSNISDNVIRVEYSWGSNACFDYILVEPMA